MILWYPNAKMGYPSFIRTIMINHKILRYSISWQTHMWLGYMTGEKHSKTYQEKKVTPVILYQLHLQVLQVLWFEWDINHPTSVNIPSRNRRVYDAIWITLVGGWAMLSLPLWKIWVRQLGLWQSQYMEKIFQTTHQNSGINIFGTDLFPNWSLLRLDVHWSVKSLVYQGSGPMVFTLKKPPAADIRGYTEYMFSPLIIQHSSLVCSLVQITLW
jgi:hypothetical protein